MATYKQKLAAQKLVENGGNIGKAMVEAGYSKATAKTPKKLTESLGWKELMKQQSIPDEELLKRHRELLDAVTMCHMTFPKSMTDEEIREIIEFLPKWSLIRVERDSKNAKAHFSKPDHATQIKVLTLAYRLYGLLGGSNKDSYENDQVSQEATEAVARFRKIFPDSKA